MTAQDTKEKQVDPLAEVKFALRNLGGETWPFGNTAADAIDALIKQRIQEALEKRS